MSVSTARRSFARLARLVRRHPVVLLRRGRPVLIALHPNDYARMRIGLLDQEAIIRHQAVAAWIACRQVSGSGNDSEVHQRLTRSPKPEVR